MDTIKSPIEMLSPTQSYNSLFSIYIPIIIALLSLLTSIYSLYITREQFRKSTRPFVWALNYAVVDNTNNTLIPIPWRVAFRVRNSPAKILQSIITIKLHSDTLINHIEKNYVRFPDERSEWTFGISKEDFERLMNLSDEKKVELERIISIKYSAIDYGKTYNFLLKQKFSPIDNQWLDIYLEAD